jgi:TonB-linked SusC/RagA family outer membrane protein
MKKLLLVSLCFLLLCLTQVYAQNRTITGTVKAKEDGLPLPGVSVRVKNSTIGTQTNASGKYTLPGVPANATLVFSFIGYLSVDNMPIPANGVLDVTLEASSHALNEVQITTAFGVKKSSGSLGYTATDVSAKSLTESAPTNFTSGLTGKVAGLVLVTADNGVNPQTRFTLRGNRHITGNNFALVVLNGVPISPNDVNTISPDDIESVDVLNGAGAAALYGSEASNGVMVITTKKGSTSGAPQIIYSNSYQLEQVSYFPKMQGMFGSYGGETGSLDPVTGYVTSPIPYENQSYGPMYNGSTQQLGIPLQNGTIQTYPYANISPDPRLAFFQTAHTEQNNISYGTGDAANSFNLSANRLDKTGILPGDTYTRNIARISATHTYGMFKADFTASYSEDNTSTAGSSTSANPIMTTLLNTASWVPLQNFKNFNAPFADRSTYYNSYNVNPYATINDERNNTRTDNFNGSFTGMLTPTKWLDITYRLAANFGINQTQNTVAEKDYTAYALSDPGGTGNRAHSAGAAVVPGQVTNIMQFGDGTTNGVTNGVGNILAGPQGFSRTTQDLIANFHHTFFSDFKTNLRVGNTIWQEYLNQTYNQSNNLFMKNVYNINYISGVPTVSQTTETIRQVSYFGDLSINYKDFAFIEGTLRNEQDSRLSAANRSFSYPSVNASLVLTQAIPALRDNKFLSYAKVRGTYAQVGDVNINPYGYQPTSYTAPPGFPYGSLTALQLNTTLNNPTLKPEITKEVEFGADLGFFDGRITGSVTYYNDHTTNQTIPITTSPSIGYANTLVNVGDVQNNGFEFKLDGQVLTKAKNKVGLDLGGNLAIQDSKVISILPGINSISIGSSNQAIVGMPFPEYVGTDLLRDPQGHPIVSATTGYPIADPTVRPLGRTTPKYILGLTQTVSYKFMSLTFVSEFRTGNVVYNTGLKTATAAGVSAFSATTGRSRFIFPNSVIQTAPGVYAPNTNTAVQDGNLNFWDSGAYYNATTTYMSSAAFWKLREADLAFDLTSWVKKSKAIKHATFTINGRNLLMFTPKTETWSDPEFGSTTNAQGNIGTLYPPTRVFGAALNLTF